MKKLLTLTAVGTLLAVPAMAVQQCVEFSDANTTAATRCTSTKTSGNADWSAMCTTNGNSIEIKGIAMCSNQEGETKNATSDTITTVSSNSDDTNYHCWCKMVEPAVSSWVYVCDATSKPAGDCAWGCGDSCTYSAVDCAYICSRICANVVSYTRPEALHAMFNSLEN